MGVGAALRPGTARNRWMIRWLSALLGALLAAGCLIAGAAVAQAIPQYNPQPNLVRTLNCPVADPWGGPRIGVRVDVYNQIRFPSDGLPGPAIALIGWSTRAPQIAAWTEYSVETRVSWRNQRTGATGEVFVPTRGRTVRWQVDLHPGAGPVTFTIRQKVGAIAFVPMVNPQSATCRGSAVA